MALGVTIPYSEALRYMGYHSSKPVSDEVSQLISSAILTLEKLSNPRFVTREFPVSISYPTDDVPEITIGSFTIKSTSLARNLDGCSQAVLFAATIGPEADRMCKRAKLTSMAEASCYQAVGAAAIEAFCDKINRDIDEQYQKCGLYTRPRFSPGYGDVALAHQKDWFAAMDITKNCGIELTDSLLMVPTKSVTAIIGISPNKRECAPTGCNSCTMNNECEFSTKEHNNDI